MKFDTADEDFTAGARVWLARIGDSDVTSFASVLANSPGYYPSTLRDLWLDELARRGLAASLERPGLLAAASLPVGHPLDYDWRFSGATRSLLLSALADATTPGDRIGYLGTPTLFVEAVTRQRDRRHVLIDANGAMVAALQKDLGDNEAIKLRLGVDLPPRDLMVDAAVLDPPWYPADSLDFLSAAVEMTRGGGAVLLSQPTTATRPGVEDERRDLLEQALLLGCELSAVQEGVLLYATPHFERMSLTAEEPGFPVPEEWRRGDLLVFRRTEGAPEHQRAQTASLREEWQEVSFGPVRIKLRASGGDDLGRVDDSTDRLVTVSRRDPLRERVGFWTSGNRVRTLGDPDAIASLIKLCDNDLVNMTFTHSRTHAHASRVGLDTRVADELFEVLLLEYQEHVAGGYGDLA